MPGLKPGFGRLATLGEVGIILDARLPSLSPERVTVRAALHRSLAAEVVAPIDVPHFAKAAMDGYAVVAEDTFGAGDNASRELRVVGSVSPGQIPTGTVERGTCVEIGTGAPLPDGADAVVMVEYTEPADRDAAVRVRRGVAPRENVIERGSDLSIGRTVLERGTRLEPRHLGVLGALGLEEVEVLRRPRVVLASTGPELLEAGETLEPGRIFDINCHTLGAALALDGCEVVDYGIVPDERAALEEMLRKGLSEGDLVLLSGGSSLGGGDLVGDAIAAVGTMLLHGVAVKPGKPVVLGVAEAPIPEGGQVEKVVIGLPGYPLSALSDYYIFVQPFLRRALGGAPTPAYTEAILARKHPSTVGRYEFLPVRLEGELAHPLTKGSSAISAMAGADGFVEIDENVEVVERGERVRVRLF
ncbi:MAG: molybdopterin-binding protein [Actinomycetota bacterium]